MMMMLPALLRPVCCSDSDGGWRALAPSAGACAPDDLVGDEALAGEFPAGLVEAEVGGREDHVGALQLVVAQRRALRTHVVQQRGEGIGEAVFAAAVDDRQRFAAQLVDARGVTVREPVLTLAGDADD